MGQELGPGLGRFVRLESELPTLSLRLLVCARELAARVPAGLWEPELQLSQSEGGAGER